MIFFISNHFEAYDFDSHTNSDERFKFFGKFYMGYRIQSAFPFLMMKKGERYITFCKKGPIVL